MIPLVVLWPIIGGAAGFIGAHGVAHFAPVFQTPPAPMNVEEMVPYNRDQIQRVSMINTMIYISVAAGVVGGFLLAKRRS